MKKLFFVSAFAIGVLGSCSSDEAVAPGSVSVGSEEGLVPVEFTLGSPSLTVEKRSIGTVGDTINATWAGEKLYVLMMQRSISMGSKDYEWGFSKWEYEPSEGSDIPLSNPILNFANLPVYAPTTGKNGMITWDDPEPKYYPGESFLKHDFFAYHVDDAVEATDLEANGRPRLNDVVNTEGKVVAKSVNVTISGSQDIMAGVARNMEDGVNIGFNSKTARRGDLPRINMRHLLSRFTFSVQGNTPAARGLEVTRLALESRAKASLIVAYDLADPANEPSAPNDFLVFEEDDLENPVIEMELKDRAAANTTVTDLTPVVLEETEIPVLDEDGNPVLGEYGTPEVEKIWNRQAIGHALMVAPGKSEYILRVSVKQKFDSSDSGSNFEGSQTIDVPVRIPNAIINGVQTSDTVAEPGSSYHVNIKLYGAAKIEVEVDLEDWKNGGDIDCDTNID